jgi:hypothetical protein
MNLMTIKARRFLLGGILVLCLALIGVFIAVNSHKADKEVENAFQSMSGFVLTDQGIEKVEQNSDTLETAMVLEKDNIASFDVVDNKTLVYEVYANKEDTSKSNIFTYNLDTKKSDNVFASTETNYFSSLHSLDNGRFGVLETDDINNVRRLMIFNVSTGVTENVGSPTKENFIIDWIPSPDGKHAAFKGVNDDAYVFNIEDGTSTLIGTFNNQFGFLDNNTIWVTNIEDDKKMSVFNIASKQSKEVKFADGLVNKTFLNGALLTSSPTEKVIWTTSGFYNSDTASQLVIATDGTEYSTIYDLTYNGYKFLSVTPSFDATKQIMSIASTDNYDNNVILVIDTTTGQLLTTLFGKQFIYTS